MKVGTLILAMVSAVFMACGSPAQMTVDEYIDWCEASNRESGDVGDTWGSLRSYATETLKEVKKVNPPDEVKEYHDVQIRGLEVFLDLAEGKDDDTALDADGGFGVEPEFLEFTGEMSVAINNLPPTIASDLRQAGCL